MAAPKIAITELMDTPDGRDEIGTPDDHLERCETCGVVYRADSWHRCVDGERVGVEGR